MSLKRSPRLARIVCTLGPSTESRAILEQIVLKGMNVARLNFSHGTHESHRATLEALRDVSRRVGREVAVLQDLQGHKVRVGRVEGAESIELEDGDTIRMGSGRVVSRERIGVDYPDLARVVSPGNHVYLDDGLLDLVVTSVDRDELLCQVAIGGSLRSRKGVIFPDSDLEFPLINDKDLEDAKFGATLDVDMVAMSFVRSATEILEMRIRMGEWGAKDPFIVAKIEDRKGIENLEEILHVADGVLIARGDLGVTLPRERVPGVQNLILKTANAKGVPVITATQMLESMIQQHKPTRAEVGDVYHAVSMGTDAVMLSGETASGDYPVLAVEEMERICRAAENDQCRIVDHRSTVSGKEGLHHRMAAAAVDLAYRMEARCILGFSLTGSTLRALSSARPTVPVIGVVDDLKVLRRLLLHRGLDLLILPRQKTFSELVEPALLRLQKEDVVSKGDRVIVVAGIDDLRGRRNHTLKVYEID